VVLGVFRKRSGDADEAIPEDLLENVPEIGGSGPSGPTRLTVVAVETAHDEDEDPLKSVRESLDRASQGLTQMARRVKELEVENARLAGRLREAEAKAAVLDEVRASLNKAR